LHIINFSHSDCCDGTDEWNGKVTCPNTCREQGEYTRKEKLQALEDYKEVLKSSFYSICSGAQLYPRV